MYEKMTKNFGLKFDFFEAYFNSQELLFLTDLVVNKLNMKNVKNDYRLQKSLI